MRRIFRRKECEQERKEREEVMIYRCRNDARKFYHKVKRLTEGFKPGSSFCKNEDRNLYYQLIYPQGVLQFLREHFSTLLQDDDDGVQWSKYAIWRHLI